jgi:Copper transport outer membrane protein, MctB
VINLRYHVVSLVAVFLALTVGIVMGSTVVDKVTVDALNARVNEVSRSVRNAEAENARLGDQLKTVRDFADQARDHLSDGHLRGVPVLVLGVTGIDRKPVDGLRQALVSSEATLAGTVWFTAKMRLDSQDDTRALASTLGLAADQPEVVRRQALEVVAATLSGARDTNPLPALADAGFVVFDSPPNQATALAPALTSLPAAGLRVVLVSGAGGDVSDDDLAVPLAVALGQSSARLVAAEAGKDTAGGRSVFVGLLRKDTSVGPRISTVDDLESAGGQAAVVLALADLALPRTGHYGVGPGAERLLPPSQA